MFLSQERGVCKIVLGGAVQKKLHFERTFPSRVEGVAKNLACQVCNFFGRGKKCLESYEKKNNIFQREEKTYIFALMYTKASRAGGGVKCHSGHVH